MASWALLISKKLDCPEWVFLWAFFAVKVRGLESGGARALLVGRSGSDGITVQAVNRRNRHVQRILPTGYLEALEWGVSKRSMPIT